MIYNSPELAISYGQPEDNQLVLIFAFKGKFTEATSSAAASIWKREFDKYPRQKFNLIWDCTDMNGFEIGARKNWYQILSMYKRQINHVSTLSTNIMIRSAARVMLELYGISNTSLRTTEYIPLTQKQRL